MSEYVSSRPAKCGWGIKTLLVLSLMLNFICIGFVGFVYFKYKPYIDFFLKSDPETSVDSNNDNNATTSNTVMDDQLPVNVTNALKAANISPDNLPTTISPELESCLRTAVGAERAAAIEAGGSPTPTELIRAMNCLK